MLFKISHKKLAGDSFTYRPAISSTYSIEMK